MLNATASATKSTNPQTGMFFLAKWLRMHQLAFKMAFNSLIKHPFSNLFTILTIALVLMIPLSGFMVVQHLSSYQNIGHQGSDLSVFLKVGTSDLEVQNLVDTLGQVSEIKNVSYESPDESFQRLKQENTFGDLVDLLPSNPLPGVLTVEPHAEYTSSESLHDLHNLIAQQSAVELVSYDQAWVEKWQALTFFLDRFIWGLTVLVGFAVIAILSNNLKLSLERHQEEIQVLALIGATKAFIRRPFIYRAFIYSFLGSLLAVTMLSLGLIFVKGLVAPLEHLYPSLATIGSLNPSLIGAIFASTAALSWATVSFALQLDNH